MEKEKLIALVRAVQNGNETAAGDLYDAFYDGIYYFILKSVDNDPELAADLTQDTFLEILETIHKLQEPAAFVTWSKQIAYHRCTAYFRKHREILLDEQEDGYSAFDTVEEDRTEFIPDEALDKEDFKQTIQAMINELPSEQRSALLLRYFNEISVKEIAQIQGVSEGTVKSRLNYARKYIQQAVESYEKKNGIRLHITGVVPMLLWFFRACRRGKHMAVATGTAGAAYTGLGSSASASAAGTGAAAAGTGAAVAAGAKVGFAAATKVAATKVVAVVAAAAVGIAGATAVVTHLLSKPKAEVWSGQMATFEHLEEMREYADSYNTPFYYPEEDDRLSFRLEITDQQKDSYSGNLEITWEDGEVYQSECILSKSFEDDSLIRYGMQIDPLILRNYPITVFPGYYENFMEVEYSKETDTVTLSFPWTMYIGRIGRDVELTRETSGKTIFLKNPINNPSLEPHELRDHYESSVYGMRMDGSYGWMTFQEKEEAQFANMRDGEAPPPRTDYLRFPGDDQLFVRYGGNYGGEETVTFLSEVDGYPVAGVEHIHSPNLRHVELPEGMEYILAGAFTGLPELETVVLPESIRYIGGNAFEYCSSLRELVIPEGTEQMGSLIVIRCENLKRLSLPSTLEKVDGYLFYYCPGLESLEVAAGNPVYHSSGNCVIETETKTLFAGCKTSVIPGDGSVTTIGRYAFAGSTGLEDITIPEGVTEIGYSAFLDCDNLRKITLPRSLEKLDDQAFRFCDGIREICYAGTKAEFMKISGIRWDAPYHDFDFIIHCADGDLAVG